MSNEHNDNLEVEESLLSEKKIGKDLARKSALPTKKAEVTSPLTGLAGAYSYSVLGAAYGSMFGGPLVGLVGGAIGGGLGLVGGAVLGASDSNKSNEKKINATKQLIEKIGPAVVDGTQEQLREGIKSQAETFSKKTNRVRVNPNKKNSAGDAFFDAAIDRATKLIDTGEDTQWKDVEKQLTKSLDDKDMKRGFKLAAEILQIQCQINGVPFDTKIKNFGKLDMELTKEQKAVSEDGGVYQPLSSSKKSSALELKDYEPPVLPAIEKNTAYAKRFENLSVKENGYCVVEDKKQSAQPRYLS